jgi:hypothetical protein
MHAAIVRARAAPPGRHGAPVGGLLTLHAPLLSAPAPARRRGCTGGRPVAEARWRAPPQLAGPAATAAAAAAACGGAASRCAHGAARERHSSPRCMHAARTSARALHATRTTARRGATREITHVLERDQHPRAATQGAHRKHFLHTSGGQQELCTGRIREERRGCGMHTKNAAAPGPRAAAPAARAGALSGALRPRTLLGRQSERARAAMTAARAGGGRESRARAAPLRSAPCCRAAQEARLRPGRPPRGRKAQAGRRAGAAPGSAPAEEAPGGARARARGRSGCGADGARDGVDGPIQLAAERVALVHPADELLPVLPAPARQQAAHALRGRARRGAAAR